MDLAAKILNGLGLAKPQRRFLRTLFMTILIKPLELVEYRFVRSGFY